MDLDEMKASWQLLDRRLQQLEVTTTRSGPRLWPLYVGQVLQILYGLGMVLLGVSFWTQHRSEPHLLVQGLIVHLYGVAAIAGGFILIGLMHGVNYGAPVVEIQARLWRVRRVHVAAGIVLGWSWWLFWIPLLGVLAGLCGVDVWRHAPEVVWVSSALGVVGLVAMALAYRGATRWAGQPSRPRWARVVEESVAGRTLVRAQQFLDELRAFQAEA